MFEHSIKVPRHFKVAANILKKVSTEGGSVKTLLYDNKLRHFNTNVLFALLTETIKHAADIDKIFEECSFLKNEPRLDPYLAKVLTTELLYGKKKLPGNSKPEQTILSYKDQFEKYASDDLDVAKTEAIRRPRYVRINTNLLTTSDAIRAFQDEGYHFVRCTSGSYNDYLKQIQGLTEYDFTQDYHIKTIFVFSPGTKLHDHELYLENKIILQDKATALAVHLLAPPPGSVALDLCAAPGMKTTQLAAFMRNEGKIYAVERNEKRYQTLCEFVEKTGSKCVETIHKDSLEIKRGDYDDVEYILLDPSCSGSGMELSVHNYIDATRLAKLTSLQEKFLKHAMNAFPKAKRIVYSTCSLFPEENERVITNIVKASRAKWRVQDVKELLKGQWNNIGSGMYGSIGTRCLYAKPDSDFTIGFFLAVLDRDPKGFEKGKNDERLGVSDDESKSGKKKKNTVVDKNKDGTVKGEDSECNKKNNKSISGDSDANQIQSLSEDVRDIPLKKKKKKIKEKQDDEINASPDTAVAEELTETVSKKKQKKGKHNTVEANNENDGITEKSVENLTKKKKKKDKHKSIEIDNIVTESKGSANQEDEIAQEEHTKQKKHKSYDKTAHAEINGDEIPIYDENYEPARKKKKKSKSAVSEELINQHLEVEEEPKKKKKRKNNIEVGS